MNVPNRGIDILRWLSFLFDIIGSDLFSITEDIHLHANAFQVQVVFWGGLKTLDFPWYLAVLSLSLSLFL